MSDFRKVCPQCNKTFQDDDALEILTECPDDGAVLIFDAVDPIVGTRLADRFLVEAFIGRGATSSVYRAKDSESANGDVAVKVLHPHLSTDAAVIKRLSQEAKSLREFSHKCVVNVMTLGVTKQGQPFLVMELVQGQSLLEHMRQNGALSNQLCLSIFDQILDAVGAAHGRGILHRDLKPGNIMLALQGENEYAVKLLDFGIAKIVPMQGDTFFRLTQTGEMMGSLLYMSPEQCLEQDWDQRGDIYSLGCVFYEALTARAPLIGRTAFETMNKHLSEVPPPLSAVRPDLSFSPGMEQVVMKMLEKNPLHRYQNAAEVRADLKLVMEGKGASLETKGKPKGKKFSIAKLTGADNSESGGNPTAVAELSRFELMVRKRNRQRLMEVIIFAVLMLIWAVPLFAAFFFTPDALVSACLFGVLLPFLAAVSAMTIVRLGQITGVGSISLLSSFGMRGASRLLPQNEQTGSLILGTEAGFFAGLLREASRKVIEPFQRVLALPLLFVGTEGMGKTHLLASLACNDIDDARRAQFILSPDGKLANLIVRWIASHPQAKTMSRRVLLIDLDNELSQQGISEAYGFNAVSEVSERIAAAISDGAEHINEKLSAKQTDVLRASISLLLAVNEPISELSEFLTKDSKRNDVFKKLPQWQLNDKEKISTQTMRRGLEEHVANGWDDLTTPLLPLCGRFSLESDATALRIFWQHSTLVREAISKRKVMIVKGSSSRQCPLFFRLVFNEILKEKRPSALLSEAETHPAVYIDDIEECGVSDLIIRHLGSPTETGMELLMSARTLSNFATEQVTSIITDCGLGVFNVSESDVQSVMIAYGAYPQNSPASISRSVNKDLSTAISSKLEPLSTLTTGNFPAQNYFYMPKATDSHPCRLLTPSFPEIRITEVEWSIVESMRTGWMFNL